MIYELSPLHQHVGNGRKRYVFVFMDQARDISCAWEWSSVLRPPNALNAVVIFRWKKPEYNENFFLVGKRLFFYIKRLLMLLSCLYYIYLRFADIAEPHQRFCRLLQLPSDVLYLKLAFGHCGGSLRGHCCSNEVLWVNLLRDKGNSNDVLGNLTRQSEQEQKVSYFDIKNLLLLIRNLLF